LRTGGSSFGCVDLLGSKTTDFERCGRILE
jgi:hypothetical protein